MRAQLVSLLPLLCVSLCVAPGCSDGDGFTVQSNPDAGVASDAPDNSDGQVDGTTPDDAGGGEDAAEEGGADAADDVVTSCAPGTADCDGDPANGCEVATEANLDHCGSCGTACESGANAAASCNGGVCGLACEDGFEDCDDVASNGCEADLSSTATCGSCGQVCGDQHAAATCDAGTCKLTCDDGFADCNGNPSDGCEVELAVAAANCGWCGHDCGGATCDQGLCEPTALATGQDGAFALAVDDTNVYFTAIYAEVVGRVAKAGGSVETLFAGAPRGFIFVDDTHAYISAGVEFSTFLNRFPKTGPFVETEVVSQFSANRFAFDDERAFWSDASHQQIGSVPKAGGTATTLATGQVKCFALAVNTTTVFWGLFDAEEIRAVPKSGGTPFLVVSGAGKPAAMAADDTHLYWITPDGVHRATFAGSSHEILAAVPSGLTSLTIDDANVYFSSLSDGYVKAVSKNGGEVRTYATGLSDSFGLAVDDDAVYFTEASGTQGGAVSRVSK